MFAAAWQTIAYRDQPYPMIDERCSGIITLRVRHVPNDDVNFITEKKLSETWLFSVVSFVKQKPRCEPESPEYVAHAQEKRSVISYGAKGA